MDEYNKDPRVACKYGANCYQKNPDHKMKFKHPPRDDAKENSAKRFKKDVADEKRDAADEKRDAADEKRDAADEKRDAADEKRDAADEKRDAADEKKDVADKKKDVADKKKDVADKKKYVADEKKHQNSSVQDMDTSDTGYNASSEPSSSSVPDEQSNIENTVQIQEDKTDSEDELPPLPDDVKLAIKQGFLVEMPDDFYKFWQFCKSLSEHEPERALKGIKLSLVGPYDVLSGKIRRSSKRRTQSRYFCHWRFYYDPPEFQTVLVEDGARLYHIGYFRDDPNEMPCFVASNCASKDGIITSLGPNIFCAVNSYIEDLKKSADPFTKMKISKVQKALQAWAQKEGFTLDSITPEMKERTRKTVCKTFHRAGLVVPYNRKSDIGYRPLIESNEKLRQILTKLKSAKTEKQKEDALEELHPIINAANIANDECDFGTSIELGLDLFTFGAKEVEQSALQLLTTGYSLVKRNPFAEIVKAHLKHRKKGSDVDMFA